MITLALDEYDCHNCGARFAAKILRGPTYPMPHHYMAAPSDPFVAACPICGGRLLTQVGARTTEPGPLSAAPVDSREGVAKANRAYGGEEMIMITAPVDPWEEVAKANRAYSDQLKEDNLRLQRELEAERNDTRLLDALIQHGWSCREVINASYFVVRDLSGKELAVHVNPRFAIHLALECLALQEQTAAAVQSSKV